MIEEVWRKLVVEILNGEDKKLLEEENGGEDVYEKGFKYVEEFDLGKDWMMKKFMCIREDMVKYFFNLDFDFVKYNFKKCVLVDVGVIVDKLVQVFVEEVFFCVFGEVVEFEKVQRYVWEVQELKGDISLYLQVNLIVGVFV